MGRWRCGGEKYELKVVDGSHEGNAATQEKGDLRVIDDTYDKVPLDCRRMHL